MKHAADRSTGLGPIARNGTSTQEARGGADRRGTQAHSWRLEGWAKTDFEGRFEFRTIRPGPYPGRREAAHIHLTLFPADGARDHA